jgi:hypothetical protein
MPYQEAQFGKILKPATRAGFKIWSGRQKMNLRSVGRVSYRHLIGQKASYMNLRIFPVSNTLLAEWSRYEYIEGARL